MLWMHLIEVCISVILKRIVHSHERSYFDMSGWAYL